ARVARLLPRSPEPGAQQGTVAVRSCVAQDGLVADEAAGLIQAREIVGTPAVAGAVGELHALVEAGRAELPDRPGRHALPGVAGAGAASGRRALGTEGAGPAGLERP